MDNLERTNRTINAIGWGSLFILWGITILFDFVHFGAGLIGTGLIFLGANAVRVLNGQPTQGDNTVIGILAISWGVMELGRPVMQQLFVGADLDWVIFAILLVVYGAILLVREILRINRERLQEPGQGV